MINKSQRSGEKAHWLSIYSLGSEFGSQNWHEGSKTTVTPDPVHLTTSLGTKKTSYIHFAQTHTSRQNTCELKTKKS